MKILEMDKVDGKVRLLYFNWKKLSFEPTCWAADINKLLGATAHKNQKFIMLYR